MIDGFLRGLESVFTWLLEGSWQASVLVALVLLLQVTLRGRLNPRWHHALWLLVVLRLVLPVLPESALSLFQFTPQPPPAITHSVTEPIFIMAPIEPVLPTHFDAPAPAYPFSLYTLLALIWLAGALGFLLVTWLVNYRFGRHVGNSPVIDDSRLREIAAAAQAELGLHRSLRLIESSQINSPAIMGIFQPTLLLPVDVRSRFSDEELRFIFLHEFAHLKRNDLVVQWLIALLQILHWFNPVLWYAFRRMRIDREPATDALVLSHTGETEKDGYGHVLIKLLEHYHHRHSLPTLVGILEDKDEFKQRFYLITKFTRGAYGWSLLGLFLIATLAIIGLTKTEAPRASAAPEDARLVGVVKELYQSEMKRRESLEMMQKLLVSTDQIVRTNPVSDPKAKSDYEVAAHTVQQYLAGGESSVGSPNSFTSLTLPTAIQPRAAEAASVLPGAYTDSGMPETAAPINLPASAPANNVSVPSLRIALKFFQISQKYYTQQPGVIDAALERGDITFLSRLPDFDLLSDTAVLAKAGEQAILENTHVLPLPTDVTTTPPQSPRFVGIRTVTRNSVSATGTIDLSIFPEITNYEGTIRKSDGNSQPVFNTSAFNCKVLLWNGKPCGFWVATDASDMSAVMHGKVGYSAVFTGNRARVRIGMIVTTSLYSADGMKMSLGHADPVQGQVVTVNVSPSPVSSPNDAEKSSQVQIELKICEIDNDVYAANKDKIDAALKNDGNGVVELLENMKGVSLLSAPSVTTMPGLKANIDIVRALPYPISFNPAESVTGTSPAKVIRPTPRDFQTRDVGVSAEIMPTVLHDKIDLYCNLHITDFVGFTETNQAIQSPAFETREANLLEEFDEGNNLKGAMIPGFHFDEETVTDRDNAGKVLSTTKKISKKRLIVFLNASLVPPDGSASTPQSH